MTFKGICNGHVFSDCCNGVLDNGRCRTCGEFSENQCSSCGENCRERSTSLFADGGVHRHVKWFLADAPVVFPSARNHLENISRAEIFHKKVRPCYYSWDRPGSAVFLSRGRGAAASVHNN